MKLVVKNIFILILVSLYSVAFIFSYGSYGCDSKCEMCRMECKCDMMDASMDADGLEISNYCPQITNEDLLSVISAEQISLRIFKGFSDIKVVLDKTILSDLSFDTSFLKNPLIYKPPDISSQIIHLKTSRLLI